MSGRSDPPVLETERLRLDGHEAADWAPLQAMWSEPEVLAGTGGRPCSPQESWMRLLRYRGLWPVLGYGYWAVREKATGRFVGDVGFAQFGRASEPPLPPVPEAGWVLASWARGQGFAGEALGAALGWLDGAGHTRTMCLIVPGNARSIQLAARHLFLPDGQVELGGKRTLVMTRAAPVR